MVFLKESDIVRIDNGSFSQVFMINSDKDNVYVLSKDSTKGYLWEYQKEYHSNVLPDIFKYEKGYFSFQAEVIDGFSEYLIKHGEMYSMPYYHISKDFPSIRSGKSIACEYKNLSNLTIHFEDNHEYTITEGDLDSLLDFENFMLKKTIENGCEIYCDFCPRNVAYDSNLDKIIFLDGYVAWDKNNDT